MEMVGVNHGEIRLEEEVVVVEPVVIFVFFQADGVYHN